MNGKRNIAPMILARQAIAAQKKTDTLNAIRELRKTGEPLTITSVADRAKVSRRYITQHPEISAKIHSGPSLAPPQPNTTANAGILETLRIQIRQLHENHQQQLRHLKQQITELTTELETVRGELLALSHLQHVLPSSEPD